MKALTSPFLKRMYVIILMEFRVYAHTTDKNFFNQIVEVHNRIPQTLQRKKKLSGTRCGTTWGLNFWAASFPL